jgi:hypothetical protein
MSLNTLKVDTTLAVNAGIDYTGCIPAKPAKNPETNKWDHVILAPDAVVNGTLKSARVAIVTSTGQATPATVTGFVKQTTNGNYVFTVKRDTVPATVAAVRKAANEAAKTAWKNGERPSKTAPAPVAITVPGVAAPAPAPAPVAIVAPATVAPATMTGTAPIEPDWAELTNTLKGAGFTAREVLAAIRDEREVFAMEVAKYNAIPATVVDMGNNGPVITTTNTPATVPSIPAIPASKGGKVPAPRK